MTDIDDAFQEAGTGTILEQMRKQANKSVFAEFAIWELTSLNNEGHLSSGDHLVPSPFPLSAGGDPLPVMDGGAYTTSDGPSAGRIHLVKGKLYRFRANLIKVNQGLIYYRWFTNYGGGVGPTGLATPNGASEAFGFYNVGEDDLRLELRFTSVSGSPGEIGDATAKAWILVEEVA